MRPFDPTPTPWHNITPLLKAGNPIVLRHGEALRVDARILAEDNYQLAEHRVNCFDDLLGALELIQGFNWNVSDGSEFAEEIKRRALAAIDKAKAGPK